MQKLEILKSGLHDIYVGSDSLSFIKNYIHEEVSSTFIITDEHVRISCLPALSSMHEKLGESPVCSIRPGEASKNLETCEMMWKYLMGKRADRRSLLINLGGGVVSDIGGFIAGTFKRGLRYINIPTSLIGQVDAAIGGKTGINLDSFKNQLGLFNFPECVLINPEFLKTLPEEEMLSGYAEMLKYGFLKSSDLLKELENIVPQQTFDTEMIARMASLKLDIIQQDPFEKNYRKVLNFGHTFGHAFETVFLEQGKNINYGKAIAAGMICESYLSWLKAGMDRLEMEYAIALLRSKFGSLTIDESLFDRIIELVMADKKNVGTEIRLVLLKQIGEPVFDYPCEAEQIAESLNFYSNL